MNQIRILIEELNTLPQGSISEKKIKGKTYYYHQFNELRAEDIQKVFDSIVIKRDEELIKTYILDRYNYVCNLIEN